MVENEFSGLTEWIGIETIVLIEKLSSFPGYAVVGARHGMVDLSELSSKPWLRLFVCLGGHVDAGLGEEFPMKKAHALVKVLKDVGDIDPMFSFIGAAAFVWSDRRGLLRGEDICGGLTDISNAVRRVARYL